MAKKESLDAHSMLVRSKSGIYADADGETVMLNPETSNYYGLNTIGSRIWELLAKPVTLASICATLEQEYEVDPATCQADVTELLQDLIKEQLVDRVRS